MFMGGDKGKKIERRKDAPNGKAVTLYKEALEKTMKRVKAILGLRKERMSVTSTVAYSFSSIPQSRNAFKRVKYDSTNRVLLKKFL